METSQVKLRGISIQSKRERAYDKVCAWFFAYPDDELTLNELVKNIEISKTTASIIIMQLEKEGFLEKKVLGRVWRIKADLTHKYFITRKIPFNLKLVYESGLIEWISENIPNAKAVILFGSYRKGDDTDKSDIDIAVEITRNQGVEIISLMIQELGYRKNVKVNIHLFSRDHIDLNVFAGIANGIILGGFLEVRP